MAQEPVCVKVGQVIKDFSRVKLIILIRSLLQYLIVFAKAQDVLQYLYASPVCLWTPSNSDTN